MGTRADFYIGRGNSAEWLGSIAYDGYPEAMPAELLHARDEKSFRDRVAEMQQRDDFTRPEQGWPWPWDDSRTTDFAYAFDQGRVWACCFGQCWHEASDPGIKDFEWSEEQSAAFPDMTAHQNLALGTSR